MLLLRIKLKVFPFVITVFFLGIKGDSKCIHSSSFFLSFMPFSCPVTKWCSCNLKLSIIVRNHFVPHVIFACISSKPEVLHVMDCVGVFGWGEAEIQSKYYLPSPAMAVSASLEEQPTFPDLLHKLTEPILSIIFL